MDKIEVDAIKDGKREKLTIFYITHPPTVNLRLSDGKEITSEGSTIFDAFMKIRKKLPEFIFQCKGAQLNVHPSSMSSQMSNGLAAYELQLGKPARRDDIVNIFAPAQVDEAIDPDIQVEFFKKWLSYFRKRKN
ncbi:hypothetical protein [Pseudomonas rhizoryzae]|uniref:hypothetical protein n=1 Tax=Pseudomonas rhizoryzae TaxID=2571129 RepID=UPI0007373F29|nr:hypothetical protein [Pseudomonas rhizoryzae]KTT28881.1 hypothetical protein NS201_18545 [Pseudomonas psychrotolerans]KTT36970.1 hypothetical protein SB9_03465 [Pseudomonas psychrotolerans]KTT75577.1 hypothetical protein SB18R_13035 [Pseudomonas psychrotolerans]